MNLIALGCAALIVLLGGFLQGLIAFGFGLLTVPLLLTAGFPVPVVLGMATVCSAAQTLSGVHVLRHAVPWKPVGISFLFRSASMLAGVWVLRRLAGTPVTAIKFWVGTVMLSLVVMQAFWQPRPRPRLPAAWNLAAFLASGFTGGLCAMGGPPLVLWVMAHDWPADRTRAFLFAAFSSLIPVQLGLFYAALGPDVLRGAALGVVLIPAVWIGSAAGLRLGALVSKRRLRLAAYALLAAIAFSAIAPQVKLWAGMDDPGAPKRECLSREGADGSSTSGRTP